MAFCYRPFPSLFSLVDGDGDGGKEWTDPIKIGSSLHYSTQRPNEYN